MKTRLQPVIELDAFSYGQLLGEIRAWSARGYNLVMVQRISIRHYGCSYRAIMQLNQDLIATRLKIHAGKPVSIIT